MITPSQALANLLKTVEANRVPDDEKKTASPKSWISAIIIFFVVMIAVLVFAYVSTRNSKELARLRHEKNKRDIMAKNKEAMSSVEKNDVAIAEHEVAIETLHKEMDGIDAEIAKIEHARKMDHKAIELITRWRDI